MIFRQYLLVKVWPSQWKEAKVTSAHKKKARSDPSNYRPILLLSVVSKIFERITGEQLTIFLEEHHLHSSRQFVFRKGWFTSNILLLAKYLVRRQMLAALPWQLPWTLLEPSATCGIEG